MQKAVGQIAKYPKIYVFILQDKQSSYTGIDTALALPFGFKAEEHVLDTGDVLKRMLSLPIDRLQELHDLVNKEVARVKIELEVPDKSGKYQTNIDSYIEQIQRERFEGIVAYYKFLKAEAKKQSGTYDVSEEGVERDFKRLIKKLKSLPRISRQFYAFLLARGEWDDTDRFINADYLQRVCSFSDMAGELKLLTTAGLCWFQNTDEDGESATWRIDTVSNAKSREFTWEFMDYVKQKNLNLDKVVVSLDFSDFK